MRSVHEYPGAGYLPPFYLLMCLRWYELMLMYPEITSCPYFGEGRTAFALLITSLNGGQTHGFGRTHGYAPTLLTVRKTDRYKLRHSVGDRFYTDVLYLPVQPLKIPTW